MALTDENGSSNMVMPVAPMYGNGGNGGFGDFGGNGGSYARGRGRNAKRDSMGRYSSDGYSRHGDIAERLRELGEEAPESTRREIERLADKMAQM